MNVLDGPSIANLCDYDFGDQAGCKGYVPGAFMMRQTIPMLSFSTWLKAEIL